MTKSKFEYIASFHNNFCSSYVMMLKYQDNIILDTNRLINTGINMKDIGRIAYKQGIIMSVESVYNFKGIINRYILRKSKSHKYEQCITIVAFLKIERLNKILKDELAKYD